MEAWIYPFWVVLLGYTVLGLTGFGSALVIVPLLAMKWPLPEAVSLTLLMDVPASAFHSWLNSSQVQWRELRRLLLGLVVGTAAGLWLTPYAQSRLPLLVLGLFVAAVGLNNLRAKPTGHHPSATLWAGPVGMAIGLVEMLFGTAGPLVVAWLGRRLTDAQQIRASTPMIIAVAASTVLVGMALDGRLTNDLLWKRCSVLIGVSLLGVWLGQRVAYRVQKVRLRQIISTFLVVSGLLLALGALR